MSETTSIDVDKAVEEVRGTYGVYSLLNLKQNPAKVALVVATALDIHPSKAVGCPRPRAYFLPGAVAEVIEFLNRPDEAEQAWSPIDFEEVIEANKAMPQLREVIAHDRPSPTAAERLADEVADRREVNDAFNVDGIDDRSYLDEAAPFTEADFDKVAASAGFTGEKASKAAEIAIVESGDGLDALSITDLRKLSKGGVVKGGYDMKKPVLIEALRKAGVRA